MISTIEIAAAFEGTGHVVEGLSAILADLVGDTTPEILVTVSDPRAGARLALFDVFGRLIAAGQPVGRAYRWRHQIAVAPSGPDEEMEVTEVLTPHIGGVVGFFQLRGHELVRVAQVRGFSSHRISSRNLDMALVADPDADGKLELVVPNQRFTGLGIIGRTNAGAQLEATVPLGGPMTTNLVFATNATGGTALGLGRGGAQPALLVWPGP